MILVGIGKVNGRYGWRLKGWREILCKDDLRWLRIVVVTLPNKVAMDGSKRSGRSWSLGKKGTIERVFWF